MSLPPPPVDPDALAVALAAAGVPVGEVEAAAADGTLGLVALDRFSVGEPTLTLGDLADATGWEPALVQRFWRALGFTDADPGAAAFTPEDRDLLVLVARLVDVEVLDVDYGLQMTRVLGSSLARIADSEVGLIQSLTTEHARTPPPEVLQMMLEGMPRLIEHVWRRQIREAARRRRVQAGSGDTEVVVGFADLVGFVVLSQQLPDRELGRVVDRFEQLALEIVVGFGGRVVKMLGDEVMFAVDDPHAAAEIALALSEACADDKYLSDVRVGLAWGPVLEQQGDLYGPTVNLASRIVNIAYPGSVLVGERLHDAVADDAGFELRSVRPHRLKGIGRVPLWVLRRADEPGDDTDGEDDDEADGVVARARRRRAAMRERLLERLEEIGDAERPGGWRPPFPLPPSTLT